MSVPPQEVLRLARLAQLAVDPSELPELAAQLDRIVNFVAQLPGLAASDERGRSTLEPGLAALRADEVRPAGLVREPGAMAPEFVDGFFVVPRLVAMDEP